jgi:hypothetical protein
MFVINLFGCEMSLREVYIFHINFNSLHVCFDARVSSGFDARVSVRGGGGGRGRGLQLVTLIQ